MAVCGCVLYFLVLGFILLHGLLQFAWAMMWLGSVQMHQVRIITDAKSNLVVDSGM